MNQDIEYQKYKMQDTSEYVNKIYDIEYETPSEIIELLF
jgi:hypothetical protein